MVGERGYLIRIYFEVFNDILGKKPNFFEASIIINR